MPLSDSDSISPTDAITGLADHPDSEISIEQKENFGALWLVKSLADDLGISKALRPANCPKNKRHALDEDYSQIGILPVFARLLVPGISLLEITRFVNQSCALRLFSWKNSWTEDDLHEHHGDWIDQRQSAIEKSLWEQNHPPDKTSSDSGEKAPDSDLFLYDVTSS